jgi:hypothetical protein
MHVNQIPAWNTADDIVTLWHGCLANAAVGIQRNGIDLSLCRPGTDFGQGFYVTSLENQAEQFAWKRYTDQARRKWRPALIRFRLRWDLLSVLSSINFVVPFDDPLRFWSLVLHCRNSVPPGTHKLSKDVWYDLAMGPVARKWKTQVEDWPYSEQISIHTPQAAAIFNDAIAARDPNVFRYWML